MMWLEQEESAWNTAKYSIQTLTKFMEQTPSFIAHKVLQAHVLQNILINIRQPCFKQVGIG